MYQSFPNCPRRKYQHKMRFLPVVILAVLLIGVKSKVVPDNDNLNQQTNIQPIQLPDFIKDARDRISNFGAQLQEQFNVPNHEEVVNTLREHTTNFANNVQEYINNVSEEIKTKKPELESFWENMKTKLTETIDKLNVNPETTEQINQLRAKFQEGVQTVVTESENVAKTISENSSKVQEDIAKFTKQAIDLAVNASQNLNNQLQQATTEQPN